MGLKVQSVLLQGLLIVIIVQHTQKPYITMKASILFAGSCSGQIQFAFLRSLQFPTSWTWLVAGSQINFINPRRLFQVSVHRESAGMPGAVLSIAGNSPEVWPVPCTTSLDHGVSQFHDILESIR